MRTFFIFIILIMTILVACGEQDLSSKGATLDVKKQQILATEDAYVNAEVNSDSAALVRLVDDRFVLNSENGITIGKEDFINAVLNMNMIDQTISERSVIIEGNLGIIFGTAEIESQNPGEDLQTSVLRYTSIYVKRNIGWRMLALQMQSHASR